MYNSLDVKIKIKYIPLPTVKTSSKTVYSTI